MEATEYLKKTEQICKFYDGVGYCLSDHCPLHQYDCGMPKTDEDIEATVEFVEKFDLKAMPGLCKVCGYNLESDELKGREINYCPICGTKTEKAPDSAANTEQEQ